jgi:uncharacterized SAM-binding protein YcdF (DUF218 family)
MFELITQIIVLVAIYFLLRFLFLQVIGGKYLNFIGGAVLIVLLILAFFEPTNRTIGLLWGILSFPLRPLGLTLILLGYALRQGAKKVNGPQVVAATLILLISSLPLTAYLLTFQAEQRALLQNPTAGVLVQSIVVLGDGATPTDPAYRIRTQLNTVDDGITVAQRSRLLYAAQLYNEQVAAGGDPIVFVSVGPRPLQRDGVSETQAIRELLTVNGVPGDRILIDSEGVDPRTTALSLQRRLGGPEAGPIIVVSPAINIRRAASTFTRLGYRVVPRPTDFYIFQLQGGLRLAALTDLVPSAEALVITTRVVDEYLATVYYFLRGWLTDPLGV